MESLLLPISILLLFVNTLSALYILLTKPQAFWQMVDEHGMSNSTYQFTCALVGLYLFFTLTVAGREPYLTIPAALLVLDYLAQLSFMRRLPADGPLARWYRSHIGLYLSVLLHTLFYGAAVYLLWK
jgi:hypothetical protein